MLDEYDFSYEYRARRSKDMKDISLLIYDIKDIEAWHDKLGFFKKRYLRKQIRKNQEYHHEQTPWHGIYNPHQAYCCGVENTVNKYNIKFR